MKLFAVIFSIVVVLCAEIGATPAKIVIIRHGEKPVSGDNLSQQGFERAAALAPYFLYTESFWNFGTPVAIFASKPDSDMSLREQETITPTAAAFRLPVHSPYTTVETTPVAQFILNYPLYDGKSILMCWEHSLIQQLVTALGVVGAPVFPNVFDEVWVITYTDPLNPTLTILQQGLMHCDTGPCLP